jgi:epoxyqueuosine reductase QueG
MGQSTSQALDRQAGTVPVNAESATAARTRRIKEFALKTGADVVGIADPARWEEFAPEDHTPQAILPGTRSVIVMGSRGPTAGAWRSPNHRLIEVNGYDFRNDASSHMVADMIEREFDHQAIQSPALPTAGHEPPLSMMLAAVLAGLGTRSLAANIILNPKYGLLYYSATLTTLDLDYDPMLEQDVCPHPMCVKSFANFGKTPCLAACDVDEGGCLDGAISDEGRIEYSYYDRERCVSRAMNFGINSFQKALAQIVTEDDPDDRKNMIYSDFFSRSCSAITHYKESVAQCFECMRVCPVGRAERKLK